MMRYYLNAYARRPHVVEHDFSGIVVNANGTGLNEGDNVFGWIPRGSIFTSSHLAPHFDDPQPNKE